MQRTLISMILIALGVFSACGQIVSGEVLKSDKARITEPASTAADIKTLIEGNTAFGFNIYRILSKTGDNIFYSPYSISAALAMTYAGARSESEQRIADTMQFMLPQSNLHAAFNSMDIELGSRGQGAKGKDDKGFRLHVVNAIWGQKDFSFLPAFLDVLAENYGAGLRIVDYINETEKSRIKINSWVSEQTEQRIKDLIPAGALNAMTRLVLTNAIYFNAAWADQFNENATMNAPFYLIDGKEKSVSMMKNTASYRFAEGEGYRAVELPYDGGELSMVILLPQTGSFSTFQSSLNAGEVQNIIESLENRQITLSIPKFKFDSQFSLKEALTAMGMGPEFTPDADFSGMTGERDLFISDVLHKAFVAVDESGTEAAAATAVIMKATAMPMQPLEITVNRPFIFFIRDIQTGAVLFIGQILNPDYK